MLKFIDFLTYILSQNFVRKLCILSENRLFWLCFWQLSIIWLTNFLFNYAYSLDQGWTSVSKLFFLDVIFENIVFCVLNVATVVSEVATACFTAKIESLPQFLRIFATEKLVCLWALFR